MLTRLSWVVAVLAVISYNVGNAIRPTQVVSMTEISDSKEAAHRAFALQQFTLQQLMNPSESILDQLREAVFDVGMFAITDFIGSVTEIQPQPGISADSPPFAGALQTLVSCSQQDLLYGQMNEVELGDERTLRSTIAVTTNGTRAQPLPLSISQSCPEFSAAASRLRASVNRVGDVYASVLDKILGVQGASSSSHSASNKGLFQSAIKRAESLEHFHIFSQLEGADASATLTATSSAEHGEDSSVLDMHTDMGLFIIMTAAEYFGASGQRLATPGQDGRPETTGFLLELPDGEVVAPIIPESCLLVMNGEGSSLWMQGSSAWPKKPQAPGHELAASAMAAHVRRAWFGRMYLPAGDALLQEHKGDETPVTFKEYRESTYKAFKEGQGHLASAAGCSPSRRRLMDAGTSCPAGQVYCWLECMALGSLPCSTSNALCVDTSTGQLWDGVNHCFNCQLECPASPPPLALSPSPPFPSPFSPPPLPPPPSPSPLPPPPSPSPSPPPPPPSPQAPNLGLNSPLYQPWDLFNTDPVLAAGPVNGTLGTSYVMLSSMPVSGSTLGVVVIAPCSTFMIHSHPRGAEQSMVLQGPLDIGYLFENNTYYNYTAQAGQFMVFPEGTFHWQTNKGCTTASFAISFPVPNPGTISATANIATIPSSLQQELFGVTYTISTATGVGAFPEDATCVKSCRAAA